jgi:hypothetical protein
MANWGRSSNGLRAPNQCATRRTLAPPPSFPDCQSRRMRGLEATYTERNPSGRDRRNWDTALKSTPSPTPVASYTEIRMRNVSVPKFIHFAHAIEELTRPTRSRRAATRPTSVGSAACTVARASRLPAHPRHHHPREGPIRYSSFTSRISTSNSREAFVRALAD